MFRLIPHFKMNPFGLRLFNRSWRVVEKKNLPSTYIQRFFRLSAPKRLEGMSDDFKEAIHHASTIPDPDTFTRLKLYGLYKQATLGENTTKRPGSIDVVGKAKWDAWSALGNMSQAEAEREYVIAINTILKMAHQQLVHEEVSGLVLTTERGIKTIKLNRPNKKNALLPEMYMRIAKALREANEDDSVNIVVITGEGDYYCSGHDLSNILNVTDLHAMADINAEILREYVDAHIDLRKPLVALVNGPAVGIAVSLLGLCDSVFCSDKATFTTPVSALGQSPEGCSSYTFPKIMGYAKAGELLLFNQKFTAQEAENLGLVTKVFSDATFQSEAWTRVKEMMYLPLDSLIFSKDLVRGRERDFLREVNRMECERLHERLTSDDCMKAVMKFFSNRAVQQQ